MRAPRKITHRAKTQNLLPRMSLDLEGLQYILICQMCLCISQSEKTRPKNQRLTTHSVVVPARPMVSVFDEAAKSILRIPP